MRTEINLTDEQIAEAFDRLGSGATVEDVTFTRDTLEQMTEARKSWMLPGKQAATPAGTLLWRGAQPFKGQPCCNFYAVDFGTVRGVVTL